LQDRITAQKIKISRGNPKIELIAPCTIDNGINQLNAEQISFYGNQFDNCPGSFEISFFIPASGSGSRMFDALFDILQNKNPQEKSINDYHTIVTNIKKIAPFNYLLKNLDLTNKNDLISAKKFASLILNEEGLNFGNLPKGLIPFHQNQKQVSNPFQEHLIQGTSIAGIKSRFHFTINMSFLTKIQETIFDLQKITGINYGVDFSEQDPTTHSFAFDENNNPTKDENGNLICRPAGHGALINNLNKINADLIFIRNIDNISHQNHCSKSIKTRKALAGILLEFQQFVFSFLNQLDQQKINMELLHLLNNQFDLRIPEEKYTDINYLRLVLNRPIRVCGMVKNDGQPGGGPFWIIDKYNLKSRQIIEQSQISNEKSQKEILNSSTHFNPVELVCSVKNYQNQKFNLTDYKNDEQYFIVHKTHLGKPIRYIEEPGLWNGAMEHWITLFYEIDGDCFSPVKTILDLMQPLHQE